MGIVEVDEAVVGIEVDEDTVGIAAGTELITEMTGAGAGMTGAGAAADGTAAVGFAIGAVAKGPLGGSLVSTRRVLGSTTGAVGGNMTVDKVVAPVGAGRAGRSAPRNALAGQLHAQLQAPFSMTPVPLVNPSERELV